MGSVQTKTNLYMPKHIGDLNKNQVLSILRDEGPTSRVELSRLMGISPTSITRNTAQLIKNGIIREGTSEESEMGRKPVLMELCGDFCYVLAADIVGGTLRVALADFVGKIIKHTEEPIQQEQGAMAVMDQLLTALQNIITRAKVPQEKVWAITIGTPGIFYPEVGKSRFTYFLDGWEDIDIRSRVFEKLSIQTIIENDVNLDVTGESWRGVGKNYNNIFYVKLGQGLSGRVVKQGELLRGEHDMAGEIGYMLPCLMSMGMKNFEYLLSNAVVSRKYKELTGVHKINTISDLCHWANKGDTIARTLVTDVLNQFAVVLVNSVTILDPQVIILGGEAISFFGEKEMAQLKQRMDQYYPLTQNIVSSKLDKNACIYGAIKRGLDMVEERIIDIW